MSERNTLLRSMHDVGAAAWFGGSLMGAVGLNGAASDVADPADRARVSAAGWARWAPVQAAAIGVHAIGGLGLILANKGRVGAQAGQSHAEAATTPSPETPGDVSAAQKQLSVLQWATPVLTGILIILGAQQGEQQRPTQILRGLAAKVG